jgi:RNA polymerase sigma factor (sigma-70 family)
MINMDIQTYAKKIFGFAMLKTNNVQDAEDLSQEILLALYNSSERINKVDNVDAYVYRICAYTWSNFYRRQKRHWNSVDIDIASDLGGLNEIDELIEENERQRLILLLRKEIAYMSKLYREILVKSYFENKTIKQISQELAVPEGTVKWYIHDAKKKLREEMAVSINTQSYRPIKMSVGHSGTPGKNNEPDTLLKSLLYQNIAYAAYREPLTIEEIARKLEVGCPFVEEALDNLLYSDLVKKIGNKYQTSFFITDKKERNKLLDLMIERSEEIAVKFYEVLVNVLDKIRRVGFLGCDLDKDILLWTIYPYYIQEYFHKAEDYRVFSKATPSEHKDGGKYVVRGYVDSSNGEVAIKGKYTDIYPRYDARGIKSRGTDTNLFSFQIDSYFQGAVWREFNQPDLEVLWRIGHIVRNAIEPNDFEKIAISEYVQKGYLSMDGSKVKFNFPLMTKEEKEETDKIIEQEMSSVNCEELFGGLAASAYKLIKESVPASIDDNDIRYRAASDVVTIVLGCMEYLERIGKLRTPTEAEKGALTTLVWKE